MNVGHGWRLVRTLTGAASAAGRWATVGALTLAGLSIAAVPALASSRSHSPVVPPAFHVDHGRHGSESENVCSYDVSPGYAHCNASRRFDPAAASATPSRDAIAQPNVLGNGGAYDPKYLQSAYNIASLTAQHGGGAGQIVAIVDAYDEPNIASDLAFYRNYFNLPPCPSGTVSSSNTGCVFQKVNEVGTAAPLPAANASWGTEIALDVDMVSAICPKCQILLLEGNTASINDLGTAVTTAVSMGANVVSNSYGSIEFPTEDQISTAYFNHPGIPIVASSGDSGFGVEFPAASPLVTAVGGTTLNQATNTGTRNATESVWSGAGAGCSAYEPKPVWQTDSGCSNRTVADVSAVANPQTGVWTYDSFGRAGFGIYGGTSVAAPIISAVYALAANPASSAAVPAQYLYGAANSLTPITSGSDGSCGTYLCDASASQNGYNGPSGLGSPGGSPNSFNAFSIPASAPTLPSAPDSLAGFSSDQTATLTWNPPSSDGGSTIAGYNIFEGTASGAESSTPVNASPVTGTSFTISSLTNLQPYFFTVEAVNGVGSSVASNEVTVTPTSAISQASPPTITSAVALNGAVSLSWSAPVATGGGIDGYNVYMGLTAGGESPFPVNSSLVSGTGFLVTGLTNGQSYYFTVTAQNAAGNSAASNEQSVKPIGTPGAPTWLVVQPDRKLGVRLTWNAPAQTGGAAVTSYQLFRSNTTGHETLYANVACTSSVCTLIDTNTSHRTVYFYEVAALNTSGAGTLSVEASAVAR